MVNRKLTLIQRLLSPEAGQWFNWMDSYRQTFQVPDGVGLPSGLTGFEAREAIIRRIIENKPVRVVYF